jgi:hypothetical protein
MDLSGLAFWAFLAVAIPGLFLPVAITRWKGRALVPVALLSLVFWPGALILALGSDDDLLGQRSKVTEPRSESGPNPSFGTYVIRAG